MSMEKTKYRKIIPSFDMFNGELPHKGETYTCDTYRLRNDPIYRVHRLAQIRKWQIEHPEYRRDYNKKRKFKKMKDILNIDV